MKNILAIIMALFPVVGFAQDYTIGNIAVTAPVARPTVATAQTGAGYMTITNGGDTADSLVAVEADFPRVMLHDSVMDGDVMRMEMMMRVDIAPGETVIFAPNGKHVMFMGLNGDPFEIGETVPATLVFENAGRLDVAFAVKDITEPSEGH